MRIVQIRAELALKFETYMLKKRFNLLSPLKKLHLANLKERTAIEIDLMTGNFPYVFARYATGAFDYYTLVSHLHKNSRDYIFGSSQQSGAKKNHLELFLEAKSVSNFSESDVIQFLKTQKSNPKYQEKVSLDLEQICDKTMKRIKQLREVLKLSLIHI